MKKLILIALLSLPAGLIAQTPVPATQPEGEKYANRAENQRDRVAQGVKSGQITPGEKANLSAHREAINHEVARERAANGGQLTNSQERQVGRQVNRQSLRTYRYKHNGRS